MSAWIVLCWVSPTLPSVLGKALHVPGRGVGKATAVCREQERRGVDGGAAHCDHAWFTVGVVGSPAYHEQSSTQLINQSHFHEWCRLRCLRGYWELINLSGQTATPWRTVTGRRFYTISVSSAICHSSVLSVPCVSLISINIDQLNIYWMRFIPRGLVVLH